MHIDFKQTYNSINRRKIFKEFGLLTKLINTIQMYNKKISNRVKINNEIYFSFMINSGSK